MKPKQDKTRQNKTKQDIKENQNKRHGLFIHFQAKKCKWN